MEQDLQEKRMNEIILKIEEIYNTKNKEGKPTGRNFITHILRAYFPQGKAHRVMDIPEKPMKCAITGQKLFAVGEIWNEIQNPEFFKSMTKAMISQLDPSKEKVENPLIKVANGRVVGITGENTDTYICQEAYEAIYNWYVTKILQDDKHISWVMRDMKIKSTINSVREALPEQDDQNKINRMEHILKHPKRATTSLGDMAILQELQEKLKAQEKK